PLAPLREIAPAPLQKITLSNNRTQQLDIGAREGRVGEVLQDATSRGPQVLQVMLSTSLGQTQGRCSRLGRGVHLREPTARFRPLVRDKGREPHSADVL